MIAQRLVIASLLLAFLCTNSQGAPPAKSILASWRAGREKIENGHVTFTVKQYSKKHNKELSVDYFFDYPNSYFFGATTWLLENRKIQSAWLYTDDFYAHCGDMASPQPRVTLVNPGEDRLGFVKNLDLRAVDLMIIGEWSRFPTLQDIAGRMSWEGNGKVEEIEGKFRITWESQSVFRESRKVVALFDPAKDFACLELTLSGIPRESGKELLGSHSQTTWIQKDGVWVPERISLKDGLGNTAEVEFVWHQINQLQKSDFHFGRFAVKKGTPVTDLRLSRDKPVKIGEIGEEFVIPKVPLYYKIFFYLSPRNLLIICLITLASLALFVTWRIRRKNKIKKSLRPAFTLLELLVVLGAIGLLFGLLLGAVQKVRQASAKVACQNNLRNLGLAAESYSGLQGHFPTGCSYEDGASPQPHMTWMTRLLPQLGMEELWQQSLQAYQAESFFEKRPHFPVLGKKLLVFLCPSDPDSREVHYIGFDVGLTDYMGVNGTDFQKLDGVYFLDSRVGHSQILDGMANTLAVGERPPSLNKLFGWWYAGWGQEKTGSLDSHLGAREINKIPNDYDCSDFPYRFSRPNGRNPCDVFHFWSFHNDGAHFLFCDGSVRFLNYSSDRVLPLLATRAGGEALLE